MPLANAMMTASSAPNVSTAGRSSGFLSFNGASSSGSSPARRASSRPNPACVSAPSPSAGARYGTSAKLTAATMTNTRNIIIDPASMVAAGAHGVRTGATNSASDTSVRAATVPVLGSTAALPSMADE